MTRESRSVPVYRVVQAGLDETQTGRLSRAVGVPIESAWAGFASERFLSLPLKAATGRGSEAEEEDRPVRPEYVDLGRLLEIQAPSAARAEFLATELLKSAGLGVRVWEPIEAVVMSGHSTLELAAREGSALPVEGARKIHLDTHVTFRLSLDGVPLIGPGAKIKLIFDANEELVYLNYAVYKLSRPEKRVAIVGRDQAIERCRARDDLARGTRVEPRLIYYAPPIGPNAPEEIHPYYLCRSTAEGASGARVDLPAQLVPAAVDGPDFDRAGAAAAALGNLPAARPLAAERADSAPTVGAEWVGLVREACRVNVYETAGNVDDLLSALSGAGWGVAFSLGPGETREAHFLDRETRDRGLDHEYADAVDLMFFAGHGDPTGFTLCSPELETEVNVIRDQLRWGNGDMEWFALLACDVLALEPESGVSWSERWGRAFAGLHLVLGFENWVWDYPGVGGRFGAKAVAGRPLIRSWAETSMELQPPETEWAIMGVIAEEGLANWNDHLWGHGPVGPDVEPSRQRGYWLLHGGS